jgi:hypothetical protein
MVFAAIHGVKPSAVDSPALLRSVLFGPYASIDDRRADSDLSIFQRRPATACSIPTAVDGTRPQCFPTIAVYSGGYLNQDLGSGLEKNLLQMLPRKSSDEGRVSLRRLGVSLPSLRVAQGRKR